MPNATKRLRALPKNCWEMSEKLHGMCKGVLYCYYQVEKGNNMTTTLLHFHCDDCLRNWATEVPDNMPSVLTECQCGNFASGQTLFQQMLSEQLAPNRR